MDCRREGRLAYEYEQVAVEWRAGTSIGERIKGRQEGKPAAAYSSAAGGLAEDYQQLGEEVLAEFGRRVAEASDGRARVLEKAMA